VGQGSSTESPNLLQLGANGITGSSFYYWLPPRTSARVATTGGASQVQVGSARVAASAQSPEALAILSYRPFAVTVSEAAVSGAAQGQGLQMFLESSGAPSQTGSIQSGIAVANPSATSVTMRLELTKLDGSTAGLPSPVSIDVPAGGQVTRFLNQIFDGMPDFRGIAKLTASSDLVVIALRGRYNERGDFLITTTAPLNDSLTTPGDLLFPHIVDGAGWATELTVFGQPGSGKLYLYSQDGVQQTNSSIT